jgi:hypothetical protein
MASFLGSRNDQSVVGKLRRKVRLPFMGFEELGRPGWRVLGRDEIDVNAED